MAAEPTAWFSDDAASIALPSDPALLTAVLPNGFRVVLRSNHFPENRLVCWLEVNVGSANEATEERGLAHVLEHCVFVGTEAFPEQEQMRRVFTSLGMSFSGDANAYTDQHSTVYTLGSPWTARAADASGPPSTFSDSFASVVGGVDRDIASSNLPTLLHLLHQMAFRATFPSEAVDKEKLAVLSEAQMRNTVDYRVDVAALAQLHGENILPRRMPIGRMHVVSAATVPQLQAFYRRWYRPELMTLYVVGPFAPSSPAAATVAAGQTPVPAPLPIPIPAAAPQFAQVLSLVQALFGSEEKGEGPAGAAAVAGASSSADAATPAVTGAGASAATGDAAPAALPLRHDSALITAAAPGHYLPLLAPKPNPLPRLRHELARPPSPPLLTVQSPLLSRFALSLSVKRPLGENHVLACRASFARMVLDVILSTAFDSRMSAMRSASAAPVFSSLSWDDSPAAEEGCAFVGLQVSADMGAHAEEDAEAEAAAERASASGSSSAVGVPQPVRRERWSSSSAVGVPQPVRRERWSPSSAVGVPQPVRRERWSRAVSLAFREALRMRRYGVPPRELQLALQSVVRECRDAAARASSDEHDDVVEELQGNIYCGSACLSPAQEYEWVKGVAAEITVAQANARCAELLAFAEAAVVAAKGALAAAPGLPAATPDAHRKLPLEEQRRLQVAQEASLSSAPSLFSGTGLAMSLFVCAPGPVDTLADAVALASKAGSEEDPSTEADAAADAAAGRDDDAVARAAALAASASASPGGLLERQRHRSRILGLLHDSDSGSGDEDGDDDEDSDDDDDQVSHGSDDESDEDEAEDDEAEDEEDGSHGDDDAGSSQGSARPRVRMATHGSRGSRASSSCCGSDEGSAGKPGGKAKAKGPHSRAAGASAASGAELCPHLLLPSEILAAIACAEVEEDGAPLRPPTDISLPSPAELVPEERLMERAGAAAASGVMPSDAAAAMAGAAAAVLACTEADGTESVAAAAASAAADAAVAACASLFLPWERVAGDSEAAKSKSKLPMVADIAAAAAAATAACPPPLSLSLSPSQLHSAFAFPVDADMLPPPAPHRLVDPTAGVVSLRLANGALLTYRPSRAERHTLAVTLLARGGNSAETAQGLLPVPVPAPVPVPFGVQYVCASASAPAIAFASTFSSASAAASVASPVLPHALPLPLPPGITDVALRAFLASGAGGHSAATIERLCTLWGVAFSSAAAAETIGITMTAVSAGTALADAAAASAPAPAAAAAAYVSVDSARVVGGAGASAPESRSESASGSGSGSESCVALWHMLLLLHLFLFSCEWDEAAVARVRADKASELADACTSLEQMADLALLSDAFGPGDGRAVWPTADAVRRMRREGMQAAIAAQLLQPGNLQIIVTGDFDWRHVEAQVARFLGPLIPTPTPTPMPMPATVPTAMPLSETATAAGSVGPTGTGTGSSPSAAPSVSVGPTTPDDAANAVVAALAAPHADADAAPAAVSATAASAAPAPTTVSSASLVSALASRMGMAGSAFVTPRKGDAVTVMAMALPTRSPAAAASADADGDDGSDAAAGSGTDHGSGKGKGTSTAAGRSGSKLARGSRKGKGRRADASAAVAAASVQLQRQSIALPGDPRMGLHGPLAAALERVLPFALPAGRALGTEPPPLPLPHPDTAWVAPLRDSSGSGAGHWYAPFSGSLTDIMRAMAAAAAAAPTTPTVAAAAPGACSTSGDTACTASASASASGPVSASARLSAPLPLLRSPAPLPPVLLSGRVVTLPEEKEARCQISIALPCRGKYAQALVAAVQAVVTKLAVASSDATLPSPSPASSRVQSDLRAAAAAAGASLASLSPGYDPLLPPVLPLPAAAEAVARGLPATALPTDMRVNRCHPLFLYRAANVWNDVISNRLYRVLRDESGSCYAASFSLSASEFADAGFGHATATPLPSHTARVLASAVRVLVATLSGTWPLSEQEVEEARAPIALEVATSLHSSSYWGALLKHAHGFHGSQRTLAVALAGMRRFYECVSLEDVQAALACEWAAAPRPLPMHVTVGIAAGASAAAEARARASARVSSVKGKGKNKGKGQHKQGAAGTRNTYDHDDYDDALTEAALRRELGLRLPAAAARGAGAEAAAAGGSGPSSSSGGGGRWDGVWQDLLSEASRCFYSGLA